jgi:hypothetical protein
VDLPLSTNSLLNPFNLGTEQSPRNTSTSVSLLLVSCHRQETSSPRLTDRSSSTMARLTGVDFLLASRIFCYSHPRSCLSHGTRSRIRVHWSRGCLITQKANHAIIHRVYIRVKRLTIVHVLVHGLHDRILPYRHLSPSSNGNTFLPAHPSRFSDFPSLHLGSASRNLFLTDALSKPPLSVRLDFIQWRYELWDVWH